jgi:hypothetical protein
MRVYNSVALLSNNGHSGMVQKIFENIYMLWHGSGWGYGGLHSHSARGSAGGNGRRGSLKIEREREMSTMTGLI